MMHTITGNGCCKENSFCNACLIHSLFRSRLHMHWTRIHSFLNCPSLFDNDDVCYNYSLFAQHGVAILEDLLITLADGIASTYLELISVDSSMSNEMNNLDLSLCTLSTRALQRLRNEVTLNQWLHQNMAAVVSMYEDRFELCTLRSLSIEKSYTNEAENFSGWKQFSLMRSGPVSSELHFVVINQFLYLLKGSRN